MPFFGVSIGCLEGVWEVSERCLGVVWGLSGGCMVHFNRKNSNLDHFDQLRHLLPMAIFKAIFGQKCKTSGEMWRVKTCT